MPNFPKSERLSRKKVIDALFADRNRSTLAHPVRLVWKEEALESPVQVMFSVPKRNFKKATERNRIKRQMREAYRLNKEPLLSLCEKKQKTLALAFLFIGKDIPDWEQVRDKIIVLLNRLNETLESSPAQDAP